MTRMTIIALIGALLLVAGCGGAQRDDRTQRVAKTTECPEITDNIDSNGTFTWMYSVDNSSFDPDNITTNNSQMFLYPIYDTLVHINEKGEPEPMLAESWQASDGGNVLELTLIKNWRYHDGAAFNAESVVKNIERSKRPGSFNQNPLEIVNDVEATGEHTVRFETDRAAGALIGVLGGAAGMMMSPKAMNAKGQDVKPTGGSGPYRMTNYVSGSRAEYTAVENYWDPPGQRVAKMVYLIAGDDNARLNAVTTGSADATFLRASMYQPARESGVVLCEQPSLSSYSLDLNTKLSEFGNKKVRLALNHAIDRTAVAAITDGFCAPGAQLFPDWYFASSPRIGGDYYSYDPEKAKRLLAEAGLEDGFEFDMEVVNLTIYQQIAEIIQANLAEIGITMSIMPIELDVIGEHFSVNQNVPAVLGEQKADADPSSLTSSYYDTDGFNNPGGWGTAEIGRLNQEAMAATGSEQRHPAYAKLFDAVAEQVPPHVTLCHLTSPFAMNKYAKGVEIYADGSRQFRGVGVTPKN
ncbi:peptide/nickel transport system substrate-binding protein [Tamaricihabitans halophyticus]|uniref:Peptide/nickel transport system substrate-binding protein n=1 Tax=Tamaricihabitans halophyticus TaxID=1262583 RepID=A0A4V2SV18_9PSEU|nr:ABC transporter substrate-binding protein [Tamaricihabitans halophyticus]TCP56426.1 peptide/nickel transport system substrate-binding protein [Tamaricihabitans halophyticus]